MQELPIEVGIFGALVATCYMKGSLFCYAAELSGD